MTEDRRPLVLHVIHHLVTGGMENGLINLIDGLPSAEFRHAIACIEDYSEFRHRLRRKDVEIVALHRSRVGIWQVRRQLFKLCRRLRPAIVHTRNLSGLDALPPARMARVPACVHGEHGFDVDNLKWDRWKPSLLRKMHSPLVNRYVTVSKQLENYLTQHVGVAPSRITRICNGVDTTKFAPATLKPVEMLPPHLRGESLTIVGTVGRAQPVKDQATLLRAIASLVQRHPRLRQTLRVAIIGDGPMLSGLRDLAATLGIADIAWLPGAMDNIPGALQLFDMFVLPSLGEGISNTILEAMSSGLPVIATDVGGNGELVDTGKTGELFSPNDSKRLTDLMHVYLQSPEAAKAVGRAGRARIERDFSLGAMLRAYRRLYDQLLSDNADAVARLSRT
ncbi:MAG: TIGR03088 family PEP-CTERM/XrtA system glycosyltransferase [Betaproteobacteria bacterium]